MREILFRGKRRRNGEWLKGYLLYDDLSDVAAIVRYVNLDGNVCDLSEVNISEVVPETVGQYTGLTDKNGRKIFEGDICKFSYPVINGYCTGVVNYFLGSFVVDSDFENLEFSLEQLVIEDEEFNVEVIGNIHDNPELLSVESSDGDGSGY